MPRASLLTTAHESHRAAFGTPPSASAHAPGRINLIGEHTDYNLLPVLPMAIDRGTAAGAADAGGGIVRARSAGYAEAVEIHRATLGHGRRHDWGRYLEGVLMELADLAPGRGATLVLESDLPTTGGLSSSSAFTMATMAALAAAWGQPLEPGDLVDRAIRAERHAGVESGGMDQTVIAFAKAGHALRIDFDPPARTPVPLPAGLLFVAASSGEAAPKATAARDAYNERVVGARLAAVMLADEIGFDIEPTPTLRDLIDVDVVDVLVEGLPEKITAKEVATPLGIPIERITALSAATWPAYEKAVVRRVARHVLSEAARVTQAEAALRAGNLAEFGLLLNQSHNSLREDMRCSTAALDKVCAAMRKAGALGARLTGAGFGGFAIAACRPETAEAVIAAAVEATGGPAFVVEPSDGLFPSP
ncbi:MAG: galactokinase [Dehalococcoidia bacterium]